VLCLGLGFVVVSAAVWLAVETDSLWWDINPATLRGTQAAADHIVHAVHAVEAWRGGGGGNGTTG